MALICLCAPKRNDNLNKLTIYYFDRLAQTTYSLASADVMESPHCEFLMHGKYAEAAWADLNKLLEAGRGASSALNEQGVRVVASRQIGESTDLYAFDADLTCFYKGDTRIELLNSREIEQWLTDMVGNYVRRQDIRREPPAEVPAPR